jgi:hypothetical protein
MSPSFVGCMQLGSCAADVPSLALASTLFSTCQLSLTRSSGLIVKIAKSSFSFPASVHEDVYGMCSGLYAAEAPTKLVLLC